MSLSSRRASGKKKMASMRLRLVGPGWAGTGLTWGAGGCGRPPRTISAAVVPLPHLGATGAGVPGPAPGAGAAAACAGASLGAATWGAVLAGAAFLGAGMPLPAPAPAALPPVVTMDGEGKRAHRSASRSTSRERWRGAGAGTGDRIGRKKRILFFSSRRGEMPRRNARCRARRELRSIARTSALFALAIPGPVSVASARGLGALGRGLGRLGSGRRDGEGQSRGQRLASARVAAEAFRRRSDACGSVAAPRKRARDGRCGRTHVLLLRPLLGHLLELFHCGVGWAGRGSVSAGARVGGRAGGGTGGGPRHLVFPGARNKSRRSKARRRSGDWRCSERGTHCQSGHSSPRPCRRRTS